ncbi:GNAT family N-acetyltransferase [Planktomarina temperata]|nr:GNAT family N-acetyltransferase [Planktomarina temperata]
MSRNKILKSQAFDDEFFSHFRFVEQDDADFICSLRADENLNKHISKSDVNVEAQRNWIKNYKEREQNGDEYYFVIKHQTKDFGVVRMYDFQPRSFCWGSWIILPSRPAGLVTFSALLIYEIGFEVLNYPQSHFDVRLENKNVIDFHIRSGAKPTHRDDLNQYFIFERENWFDFKERSKSQYRQHRIFHG